MSFQIDCEEGLSQEELSRVEDALTGFVRADSPLCVELVFADGEEMRALNKAQRQVDSVTDVLSFPSLDGICGKPLLAKEHPFELDEEGRLMLGSIVICKERAKEQAEEYGHSYERELHYLLVHGILHCLGYDHMTDEDKPRMREQEEYLLKKMGIERE